MSDILEQEEDDYNDFDDSDQDQLQKSTNPNPIILSQKILLCNCILLKRTLLDEMDYQCMKYHLKIYKEPATCQMNLYSLILFVLHHCGIYQFCGHTAWKSLLFLKNFFVKSVDIVNFKQQLLWGSIRPSPRSRYGLNPPYRLTREQCWTVPPCSYLHKIEIDDVLAEHGRLLHVLPLTVHLKLMDKQGGPF